MDIDSPRPTSPTPQGVVDAQPSTTSQPPSQPQSESQPQPQSQPEPQPEQPPTQSSESQPSSSQVTQTETQLTSTSTDPTTIPSSAPSSQAQDDKPPAPSTPPAAPAPTSPPQREGSADSATRRGEDEPIETDSTPLANGHARLASPMNGSSTLSNGMHPREETEHDTSSSSSVSAAPSVSAATDAQPDAGEDDDLDRFLRRMDTEKKIAQLQQRLELASFKTNHGWTDMSINEIETRLPLTEQRRPQVVIPGGRGIAYEPPSPQRPWQLADSLWQNLPKPGRNGTSPHHPPVASAHNFHRRPPQAMHAPSHSLPGGLPSLASLQVPGGPRGPPPASPRRHRMDDYLSRPTVSPMRGPPGHGHTQSHSAKHHNGHGHGSGQGHRRASSSISGMPFLSNDPYPASPLRPKKAKKRSQSHSNLRERPTTQDVDAARALTFMLESARSPNTSSNERLPSMSMDGPPMSHQGPRLPPLQSNASFPPPFSGGGEMLPPRPRAQSFAAEPREPREHARTLPPPMGPPGLRTASSHTRNRGTSMDSSASFRGGFWQANSNGKPGAAPPGRDRHRDLEREREQRERDRQRERERDRNDRMMDERFEEAIATRPEDDQTAAELMMFLAHSPSPVRKRASDVPTTTFGATARVLFSENEGRDRERDRMREPAPGPRPGPPSLPAPPRLH